LPFAIGAFHDAPLEDAGSVSRSASPWATVWFSPRQTIERIVATRPTYLVLPLAMLGMVAGLYMQLASVGLAGLLGDWRLAAGFVVGGAVFGLVWLFPSALVLSWIGRLFGGEATAPPLRAVLAWRATVPMILGALVTLVILALKAAGGGSPVIDKSLPWLWGAFGLWTAIVFMLMLARVERFGFWRTLFAYLLNSFLLAFLVALFIRTLLFQPFNMPASSMLPTLVVGDYFFVSKYTYGYSHFSLPFSPPLFSGRIFASEPKRGDVVVFCLPKNERTDYVKGLVGLPGDRIQMKEGQLYINDVAVKREALPDFIGAACGTEAIGKTKRWRETLPEDASYETLDCVDNGFYDNTIVTTVPAGQYFMLGDDRDNSTDSRVKSAVGTIPFEYLIGRVEIIFFFRAAGQNGAPATVRTERIGTMVR
jgi:signal peptidase I